MGRLFGTDGVRGIANTELNCDLAYKIGRAGAFVLSKEFGEKPIILVGKDTRISGDMLEAALVAGVLSSGGDVMLAGVVPTPAIAYLVKKYGVQAGVVISASHNPMEYNGIKFFNSQGFKLKDEIENEIERLVLDDSEIPLVTGSFVGKIIKCNTARQDYIDYAKSTIDCDFKGLKIAVDCANGATAGIGDTILSDLGAYVFSIATEPNGTNINDNCGSTYIKNVCEKTTKTGSDIGIAFDGDGDRVLFSDDCGNEIDGDQVMAILGKFMKTNGILKNNTIVGTVMSNLGLSIFGEENDIKIKQASVGDRYVLEKMLKNNFNLGGEQSGHIIMLDYNTTGDGIVTALQILKILKNTGTKLSELSQIIKKLPQILVNTKVKNENKELVLKDEEVLELVENVNIKLFKKGRVLVRASGTEPLFRVMIEGEDIDEITAYANEIAELIKEKYA
jgi:phosphoglucosamine mutase